MNMFYVLHEAERAQERFGNFTSTHEGFGVLAEEIAELLNAIRSNIRTDVEREAIQVAAVAIRIADGCSDEAFARRSKFSEENGK